MKSDAKQSKMRTMLYLISYTLNLSRKILKFRLQFFDLISEILRAFKIRIVAIKVTKIDVFCIHHSIILGDDDTRSHLLAQDLH